MPFIVAKIKIIKGNENTDSKRMKQSFSKMMILGTIILVDLLALNACEKAGCKRLRTVKNRTIRWMVRKKI
jgi:hypothetical protein